MKYALGNMLNGGIQGLDPDAKAYINAVVAAGATVTPTQRNAINTFVKTGKSDGWYSSIKRLYLPIWGVAAPNAVDIISRESGTFVGTPTYGTSSVSFASGAYFNTNTAFTGQGLTSSSGYIFALVTEWTGVFNYLGGSGSSVNATVLGRGDTSNLRIRYSGGTEGSGQLTATSNDGTLGIISGSREGGDRKLYYRTNAGRSNVATSTSANSGSPRSSNVFFGGYNNNDVLNIPVTTVCTLGFWGFGLGLTDSQDSAFTLSLKTLWETCTGSTIPA